MQSTRKQRLVELAHQDRYRVMRWSTSYTRSRVDGELFRIDRIITSLYASFSMLFTVITANESLHVVSWVDRVMGPTQLNCSSNSDGLKPVEYWMKSHLPSSAPRLCRLFIGNSQ